jgi:hypothetical protein
MPGLTGQAFRAGGRVCGALLRAAMALLLVAGLGLAALSWRLAEGPMHVPILTHVVEQMIARAGLQRNVEVSDIVLAWGGFRGGAASPLAVRVSGLRVLDEAGALRQELPDIAVSFSLARLLVGNIALTDVTLRDPAIVLERDKEGDVTLAMSHLAGTSDADPDSGKLLAELLGSEDGSGLFSALRGILITNGRLVILDRQLHLTWELQGVGLALRRVGRDGAEGEGVAQLVLPGGGGTVPVRLTAKASNKGPRVEGTLEVPALEPARLAGLMPALAPLGLINASVSMNVHGLLDGGNRGSPLLSVGLRVGEGSLALRPGLRVPFRGMELRASGSPENLRLEQLALSLPPAPGQSGAPPVINATGQAALRDGRWRGDLALALNRMEVSALSAYWPADLAANARHWLVENVTAGVATGGSFKLAAESAEDLSGFRLTEAAGILQVEQATVHWLRPVPPVENVTGTVRLGLKEVVVQANSGRQAGTALNASGVTVRLFALDTDAEQMEITGRLRGPVPDAVNLIRHPRLKLFEKRPLDLKQPGGQIDATLRLATPLLVDLPADAIRVSVQAHLTALRLADVVAGQDLQRGTADLTVDNGRLRATGDAQVGGIPAKLSVDMDFRPGPATQVVERVQASGRTDIASLERFGLDLEGLAAGPISVEAVMEKPRSGETRVDLRGDLQDATMTLTPLAWRKPPGQPATVRAELRAAGENLRSLRNLRVEAPQLSLRGGGSFMQDNRLQQLDLDDVVLGRSRFGGSLRPPARQGGAWMISLRGPVLDLMPALTAEKPPEPAAAPVGPDPDPPADIVVEGRFDRVLLDQNRFLTGVQGQIRADGSGTLRQGRVAGRLQNNAPFDVAVTPRGAGRDLRLTSEDAGALLAAFDVLHQVRGGRLSVNAHWANNRPDAVLTGTAELQDFSVLDAPAVGKLLQALTVYGVFDAVQGPGLAFSQLNAPFSLSPQRLTVRDAHAFSPSLGVTVKGEMNRLARSLALDGTIVPAYALNTALGRLPLVGRLFSPEKGGGLFAASFKVNGPVDNPNVSVNPLSMLTPGFLRGLFGGGQPAAP